MCEVGSDAAYPRPSMRRSAWTSLDGSWDYAIVAGGCAHRPTPTHAAFPAAFDGTIRVPFSPETTASGIDRQLLPGDLLWYRRRIDLPDLRKGERLLLHFESVDWRCWCYVDGQFVGEHTGGYEPFAFDITDALPAAEGDEPRAFELMLAVEDPSDLGGQPRGKQRLEAIDIWYPPQSGIWQEVWMEVVPTAHLERLRLIATLDDELTMGALRVEATVSRPGRILRVNVRRKGALVAMATCAAVHANVLLRMTIPSPELWSPDDPARYDVEVGYGSDKVRSTTAFRTTAVAPDERGIPRFQLNGQPIMLRGVLYQPYWSGSLLTPPDADAPMRDLETTRDLGFNMIRVHASIAPERLYELCDQLGILVCQDFVPGAIRVRMKVTESLPSHLPWARELLRDAGPFSPFVQWALGSHDRRSQRLWVEEASRAIERLRVHPSIVMWTAFNEGWGQFEAARVTQMLQTTDPTRPIDATSGWYDQGAGDFESVHDYTDDLHIFRRHLRGRRDGRALLLSECGGLTWRVPGHGPEGETFGYEECADGEELARRFRGLIDELEGMWPDGLAGYVYTQLADVEQECNGLVTYDRVVRKA